MRLTNTRLARTAILGFLSTACDVSSQHKLPTRNELFDTSMADFFDVDTFAAALDDLIREGSVVEYGPYLSDHEIDVL